MLHLSRDPAVKLLAASTLKRTFGASWYCKGPSVSAGGIGIAGGSFGKKQQAQEGQFFKKQQEEQLRRLRQKQKEHEREIKKHQEEMEREKKEIEELERKK